MKQLEIEARLWHIVDGCEKIERYVAGKTPDDYVADDLLASAVERQLTIVQREVPLLLQRVRTLLPAPPS